jgi:hypothetical protein
MFNKEALDKFWDDLRGKYGSSSEWEQLLRDAHVGVARSDAGVDLGDIDKRVAEVIKSHAG